MAPKIVDLSKKYPNAKFYKVDVDDLAQRKSPTHCFQVGIGLTHLATVSAKLGVRAMPTFLVYSNGTQVKQIVGAHVNAIEEAVVAHL